MVGKLGVLAQEALVTGRTAIGLCAESDALAGKLGHVWKSTLLAVGSHPNRGLSALAAALMLRDPELMMFADRTW
ncbi:hypothetical protein [Mycobacterium haemophilum]|uniref:Uncharacterized protein n=1 Tax=Mycobacterium haemophilum TaxID=29311 RepID=A0A0I9U9X2_9MYCO|nr:hypothetical protein [Mycobacterium haemophilum]KLO33488.1 hypothetical protein ABH39_01190 [Mycobacterium haemophilum]KLO39014.1 hypothetical protein ABH38_01195 [Mycobacterium haemophilum]KLO45429.1 hypothetical protein ABH37_01195 [Mycobacterium haemophilum]KLO56580.1 hypothetical protein ABH36_01190 [Mycobacterium haemophilum]